MPTVPFCAHARPTESCIVHGMAQALERQRALREAARVTENPAQEGGRYHPTGTPEPRPVSALRGRQIQPILRDGGTSGPGRPTVPALVQKRKAADRAAAYRARKAAR